MKRLLLGSLLVLLIAAHQGLDLPLPPVRFGDPRSPYQEAPTPDEDTDTDEDPRDTPPPLFYGEEIDTETDSIVYVIDVSGSMNLDNRLSRAQAELIRSVNGLPSSFVFEAIAYSSVVYRCFGKRVPATPANKAQLTAWIRNFNPHGFTATGPATAQALQDRENLSVVLLTDGLPNFGVPLMTPPNATQQAQSEVQEEAHRRVIQEANAQRAIIDVFGIQARGRMRIFCQGVASDSGGSYFDVP